MASAADALFHDFDIDMFDRMKHHPEYEEKHYHPGAFSPHRRRMAPIPNRPRDDDKVEFLIKRRDDGRSVHTPVHIKVWNRRHAGKAKEEKLLMKRHLEEERKHQAHIARMRHNLHMAERRAKERERLEHEHRKKCLLSHENHLSWDSRDVGALLDRDGMLSSMPANGLESARRWHENRSKRANPLKGIGYFEQSWSKRNSRREGFIADHHHHHARKGLAGPTLMRSLALSPRAYPENIPARVMRRRKPLERRRHEIRKTILKKAWNAEQTQRKKEERGNLTRFDLTHGKKLINTLRLNRLPLRGLPSILLEESGKDSRSRRSTKR